MPCCAGMWDRLLGDLLLAIVTSILATLLVPQYHGYFGVTGMMQVLVCDQYPRC